APVGPASRDAPRLASGSARRCGRELGELPAGESAFEVGDVGKPILREDARRQIAAPSGAAIGDHRAIFFQLLQPSAQFLERDRGGVGNGFVEPGELAKAATIIGSKEEKIMLATLDDAYVQFTDKEPLVVG